MQSLHLAITSSGLPANFPTLQLPNKSRSRKVEKSTSWQAPPEPPNAALPRPPPGTLPSCARLLISPPRSPSYPAGRLLLHLPPRIVVSSSPPRPVLAPPALSRSHPCPLLPPALHLRAHHQQQGSAPPYRGQDVPDSLTPPPPGKRKPSTVHTSSHLAPAALEPPSVTWSVHHTPCHLLLLPRGKRRKPPPSHPASCPLSLLLRSHPHPPPQRILSPPSLTIERRAPTSSRTMQSSAADTRHRPHLSPPPTIKEVVHFFRKNRRAKST